MSTIISSEHTFQEAATYGGLVDAVGGVATIVLAIIALSGVSQAMLGAIATIVFGAALLIQGGTMLSEYTKLIFPMPLIRPKRSGEVAASQLCSSSARPVLSWGCLLFSISIRRPSWPSQSSRLGARWCSAALRSGTSIERSGFGTDLVPRERSRGARSSPVKWPPARRLCSA